MKSCESDAIYLGCGAFLRCSRFIDQCDGFSFNGQGHGQDTEEKKETARKKDPRRKKTIPPCKKILREKWGSVKNSHPKFAFCPLPHPSRSSPLRIQIFHFISRSVQL
ncbi:hypothetical protein CDAR_370911 [Caerostris darwini]|uniref:Uncharacterized protein n=1 Tax=Caerostris darwini TaxID=1538125 RepID=A0AAV4NE37_9ARAC|nr:hypothetical protein CDAR_370911 [Caerostris darwini]